MAGDNQEPVKGDVRRFVEGGYRPVGATNPQVLTQGPDWDGINRGIGMFLDIGSNYARQSSKGSGKQDYSGQYQVEMNDIAANPEYHDASGMYNSRGREAIRALNQKYAPYVSGAEIRATESYVGGGYKESVDNALREVNIKQRAADYEAQNTRYVNMYDSAHPENINLPFETRARLGKQMSDETNEFANLTNTLMENNLQSISNPAVKRMAEIIENRFSPEALEKFKTAGDSIQEQQEITDMLASLAVQQGHTQAEARVMATNAAQGVFAHLNKYRNDVQQLTEDELKFMKSHDADEVYRNLTPQDRAFYALTGQFSPKTMINGLSSNMSVSDAFKTEKVGDKYKRVLITSDKNVINFGLNSGDDLTASATLAKVIPDIQKELDKGNSAPLRQLSRLPALANIVNSGNQSEEWSEAKQQLADMLSKELVNNSRTYYKGNNVINDEMDYQNRAIVELAQYLGFSNEDTKNIVNKALETMGLKGVKGVYTADELVGAMSAQQMMPWAMEGIESKPKSVDIEDYLDDANRMTMTPTPDQSDTFENDEEAQMTRVNVYESPEFIEFRNRIMQAAKNRQIEPAQAINEINLKEQEIKQRQEQGLLGNILDSAEGLLIKKANAQELQSVQQNKKIPTVPGRKPIFTDNKLINKNEIKDGTSSDDLSARGIRNNNPGNLKENSVKWEGKVPKKENTDEKKKFVQFKTALDGIRALCRNIRTHHSRGKNTVSSIIGTWAPPHENNTLRYINYVCRELGVKANDIIDVDNDLVVKSLAKAIIEMENGSQPYKEDIIDKAIQKSKT